MNAHTQKLTGLFLGAGASYEIGMPLVPGLTEEICNWLTPEKLRALNVNWRSLGGGYQDRVLDDFISVLERPEQHYESLLGYLEVQFTRSSPSSQEYHGLYSWLVDLVYHLLYWRHINNVDFIRRNSAYYDGISAFADSNRPLWVFSLNHDVIVECLCLKHGVPLNSGFANEVIHLPRRDSQGRIIGELRAEVLPGQHLESSGMPFFTHGVRGVNLLKIHGALDIFTFRDGKDLLKLLPAWKTTSMDRSKHCGQPTKSSFIGPMYQFEPQMRLHMPIKRASCNFFVDHCWRAPSSSVRYTLRFYQRNCFNISGHTSITSAGLYVSGTDSQTSTSTG